jgi:hypothetical protein
MLRMLNTRSVVVLFAFFSLAACAPAAPTAPNPDTESPEVIQSHADAIHSLGFVKPTLTQDELENLKRTYAYVDTRDVVPSKLKTAALAYYQANASRITNKNYLSVVDFSANSRYTRLFIINMNSGAVTQLHVAHGKGSDTNNDGFATLFSNVSGSNKSSLGFFLTAESYNGKHGLSLRIDGLSNTNSNVRARAIVIHGATYVYNNDTQAGRSDGCFAVSMTEHTAVVNELKNGSLLYAGLSQ